jgi:hypothetical protein
MASFEEYSARRILLSVAIEQLASCFLDPSPRSVKFAIERARADPDRYQIPRSVVETRIGESTIRRCAQQCRERLGQAQAQFGSLWKWEAEPDVEIARGALLAYVAWVDVTGRRSTWWLRTREARILGIVAGLVKEQDLAFAASVVFLWRRWWLERMVLAGRQFEPPLAHIDIVVEPILRSGLMYQRNALGLAVEKWLWVDDPREMIACAMTECESTSASGTRRSR